MSEHKLGRYTGKLLLEPLGDGRRMRTVLEFGFEDEADGLHWPVPRGTTVDGASIPKALWSFLDGPWEGKYRDASVVHDYYCAVRSADWRAVHLMFYRAMLVSGVTARRAKVMYLAVYFAGPRWDDMVVEIVRLGRPAVPTRIKKNLLFYVEHDPMALDISKVIEHSGISAYDYAYDRIESGRVAAGASEIILHLDKLSDIVERYDPTLQSLEKAIDAAVPVIPQSEGLPRDISVGALEPEH
jgi:hypothetical protein